MAAKALIEDESTMQSFFERTLVYIFYEIIPRDIKNNTFIFSWMGF